MNFFNLLQLKSLSDIDETIEFEKKFKITLPPIYKSFIQTFIINKNCIHYPSYFDKVYKRDYQFTIVEFQRTDQLALIDFLQLSDAIAVQKRIYDEDDYELYKDYLPIASCAFGLTLLLGIKGGDEDKIFLEGHHLDEKIIVVANDIFDFLKAFRIIVNYEGLEIDNINPEHLYLKLGKTVWSVLE